MRKLIQKGGKFTQEIPPRRKSPFAVVHGGGAAIEVLRTWFCGGCDEDHDGGGLFPNGGSVSPENAFNRGGDGGGRWQNPKLVYGFCRGSQGGSNGGGGSL